MSGENLLISETPIQQAYPMTVVMATLGGASLAGTIEQLNSGSVVPAEILVCIPEQEAPRTAHLLFPNVKVIVTDCRGQVAQRAVGFQNASHDIVMQLDDDIMVDKNCLEYLLQTLIKYGPHVAVAPVLIESASGKTAKMNPKILRLYYFLMNGSAGYKMGAVSRAGAEFGYDAYVMGQGEHDVEWVPGGCLIHFRKNLIKDNYFPFKGKAYCEDLLHSYYLKKNGVRLKINMNARCFLEDTPAAGYGYKEFINIIKADYRARKYYVRLSSKSYSRMHLYYMALILNYLIKKLLTKNCR